MVKRKMRGLALVLTVLMSGYVARAATRMSVDQLDQTLTLFQSKPDAELADDLAKLELTQRAGPLRIASWSARLPGPKSRQALLALTDASAFLKPPPEEIPDLSAPDLAEQKRIFAAATDYVVRTIPTLPNFFADRVTTRFDNIWGTPKSGQQLQPELHFESASTVTVLYRERKEVLDPGSSAKQKTPQVLATQGEFGQILGLVFSDLATSQADWSRWEKGLGGNYAVFRYIVPRSASHYGVSSLNTGLLAFKGAAKLQDVPGYHGEIVVDPASGAVMRLSMQADMDPLSSISRADILVEYGPVEIGGRTYVCPVSSVGFGEIRLDGMPAGLAPAGDNAAHSAIGVNHTDFQRYHLFRAESRILPSETKPGP